MKSNGTNGDPPEHTRYSYREMLGEEIPAHRPMFDLEKTHSVHEASIAQPVWGHLTRFMN